MTTNPKAEPSPWSMPDLDQKRENERRGATFPTNEPLPGSPTPQPFDRQGEFAALAKFFADNPEEGSKVDILTPDEFAAETFSPPTDPSTEEHTS